jgi:hypothetical protein
MAWDPDLGDEPPGALRDHAPDILSPIDEGAPVSGHHPPPVGGVSAAALNASAPEHDWDAARVILVPILRPVGTHGKRLAELDAEQLATEGLKNHAMPLLDDGPSGLSIGYLLRIGSFDVHVNADHVLAWGITAEELRAVALANLATWSDQAAWTDEVSGARRLLSSVTGDGGDAARILLPQVRSDLAAALAAGAGPGSRVLVGVPERDLLVAAALTPGDEEFGALFAEFVQGQSEGADQPLDGRVHEIVGGELRPFEA